MFAINNVRMLLLSGIGAPYDPATGRGVVGRNYAYQTMSSVASFFESDTIINPFMASGASGTLINDFAGDNFDHSGLGFVGGAFIGAVNTNGRPIQYHPTPPGTRNGAKTGSARSWSITTTRSCSACTAARWRRGSITSTRSDLQGCLGAASSCA